MGAQSWQSRQGSFLHASTRPERVHVTFLQMRVALNSYETFLYLLRDTSCEKIIRKSFFTL
jgi:hypothetical protein